MPLRILFLGDVVGRPGRRLLGQALPRLVGRWNLGLVVANAENSAGGSGLSQADFEELQEAGVDVFTLGDHAYKHDDVHKLFARHEPVCRAANYPWDAPGPDHVRTQARDGTDVGVMVLQGRAFMPPVDCLLRAGDRVLEGPLRGCPVVILDMHAEATSEKQVCGRYFDGRVTAVLGTHTHVATADSRILPGGTAYQTDVGMCGPYDSVIGRRYDRVLAATLLPAPQRFEVATGDPRMCGALLEVDPATGRALAIRRVEIDEAQAERLAREAEYDPLVDQSGV